MVEFLSKHAALLWASILTLALFYPVRQLIWVLMVRRAQSRTGATDVAHHARLKHYATVTSLLVCCGFSLVHAFQPFVWG